MTVTAIECGRSHGHLYKGCPLHSPSLEVDNAEGPLEASRDALGVSKNDVQQIS